jgi:2-C-methyl-D-erythritol 4-phosphate cytidylyltransferase
MSSSSSQRHFALIPAAGIGSRMAAAQPKQYLPLAGKPMLLHALETLAAMPSIAHTFVIVSPEDGYIDAVWPQHVGGRASLLRAGGPTRHQSVLNGLHAMRDMAAEDDWVLVHDAARPGLTSELVERLIETLHGDPVGGLLALPIVDTLKRSDAENRVDTTVPRNALWAAQTPQMFRYGLLRRALQEATEVTDEASAIEALGLRPLLVEGSPRNLKVTLPHDVALAELYLKGIA